MRNRQKARVKEYLDKIEKNAETIWMQSCIYGMFSYFFPLKKPTKQTNKNNWKFCQNSEVLGSFGQNRDFVKFPVKMHTLYLINFQVMTKTSLTEGYQIYNCEGGTEETCSKQGCLDLVRCIKWNINLKVKLCYTNTLRDNI